jgi:hypothetical protein
MSTSSRDFTSPLIRRSQPPLPPHGGSAAGASSSSTALAITATASPAVHAQARPVFNFSSPFRQPQPIPAVATTNQGTEPPNFARYLADIDEFFTAGELERQKAARKLVDAQTRLGTLMKHVEDATLPADLNALSLQTQLSNLLRPEVVAGIRATERSLLAGWQKTQLDLRVAICQVTVQTLTVIAHRSATEIVDRLVTQQPALSACRAQVAARVEHLLLTGPTSAKPPVPAAKSNSDTTASTLADLQAEIKSLKTLIAPGSRDQVLKNLNRRWRKAHSRRQLSPDHLRTGRISFAPFTQVWHFGQTGQTRPTQEPLRWAHRHRRRLSKQSRLRARRRGEDATWRLP